MGLCNRAHNTRSIENEFHVHRQWLSCVFCALPCLGCRRLLKLMCVFRFEDETDENQNGKKQKCDDEILKTYLRRCLLWNVPSELCFRCIHCLFQLCRVSYRWATIIWKAFVYWSPSPIWITAAEQPFKSTNNLSASHSRHLLLLLPSSLSRLKNSKFYFN